MGNNFRSHFLAFNSLTGLQRSLAVVHVYLLARLHVHKHGHASYSTCTNEFEYFRNFKYNKITLTGIR